VESGLLQLGEEPNAFVTVGIEFGKKQYNSHTTILK
jgi:hypothetical protein